MSCLKLKHRLDLSTGKRIMLLNDAMNHKLQDGVIIFFIKCRERNEK